MRRSEYRLDGPNAVALPPHLRVTFFAVSVYGSISSSGQTLLRLLGKRAGEAVPHALAAASTWAAPRFAPFARMAVTFAARRGVARAVGRMWERVPEWPPRGISPSQLPLPPLAVAQQRPALPPPPPAAAAPPPPAMIQPGGGAAPLPLAAAPPLGVPRPVPQLPGAGVMDRVAGAMWG